MMLSERIISREQLQGDEPCGFCSTAAARIPVRFVADLLGIGIGPSGGRRGTLSEFLAGSVCFTSSNHATDLLGDCRLRPLAA